MSTTDYESIARILAGPHHPWTVGGLSAQLSQLAGELQDNDWSGTDSEACQVASDVLRVVSKAMKSASVTDAVLDDMAAELDDLMKSSSEDKQQDGELLGHWLRRLREARRMESGHSADPAGWPADEVEAYETMGAELEQAFGGTTESQSNARADALAASMAAAGIERTLDGYLNTHVYVDDSARAKVLMGTVRLAAQTIKSLREEIAAVCRCAPATESKSMVQARPYFRLAGHLDEAIREGRRDDARALAASICRLLGVEIAGDTECKSVSQALPDDTDEILREAQFLLGQLTDPEFEASIRLRAVRCDEAIGELRGALHSLQTTECRSIAEVDLEEAKWLLGAVTETPTKTYYSPMSEKMRTKLKAIIQALDCGSVAGKEEADGE